MYWVFFPRQSELVRIKPPKSFPSDPNRIPNTPAALPKFTGVIWTYDLQVLNLIVPTPFLLMGRSTRTVDGVLLPTPLGQAHALVAAWPRDGGNQGWLWPQQRTSITSAGFALGSARRLLGRIHPRWSMVPIWRVSE